ncbi:SseB family protein [Zafaria sp. Z1313]|uniref:SseB family protein n=1 Tax=unclassified Zafaria TaxID=2828765 RepID=UPI002E76D3BC|nr:SseB family protein [Zafaria sp. J156]MEE1621985.1 SseB family protein [Zafaria sp. J156]
MDAEGTTPGRHLPGHIEAALRRAGGAADSAGQPWSGRDLAGEGNPLHAFDADDGLPDAGYEAAVAALVAGTGDEAGVVSSLATARVFVPVLASLAEGGLGEHGFAEDKEADMALVTITAPDGRAALPVFSGVDRLRAWHPQARPVAVFAPRAALSAVSEGAQLLVVDPGSDVTFVVRRPAVWSLAKQRPWVPGYADGRHAALFEGLVDQEPDVIGLTAAPGRGVASRTASGAVVAGGGSGPEVRLEIAFAQGTTPERARAAVARIQERLRGDTAFSEGVDSLELALTTRAPGAGQR